MSDFDISTATVSRLPRYLRAAVDLAADKEATVSSEQLAALTQVNPATVRRDLASLAITGRRGVGYDTAYLVFEISSALGLNQESPVAIVGAGNIGRALCNYLGFSERGFPIRLVLDSDDTKVGQRVGQLTVQSMDDLEDLVDTHNIELGIIATPAEYALTVAERLVKAGVTSLLNFTTQMLDLGNDAVVRKVDLATELQILSYFGQRLGTTSAEAATQI